MRFDLDKVFSVHQQALQVREKRAQLIASNIANADTPGFKARDIDFKEVLAGESGGGLSLSKTHSQHLSVNGSGADGFNIKYRIPMNPSVDGNTVDMHLEQQEFASNAVQYQASFEFLDRKIKGILTAIRGE